MTALDHNTPLPADELRGLESMCTALHAATETNPVVKDVAWRTFALIRAHREQGAEVTRLESALADAQAAVNEVLEERDDMEKLLDTFAYTIAPEEVIGEHSSGNDPWQNALDLLAPADYVDRLKAERDQARETATHMAGVMAKVGPALLEAMRLAAAGDAAGAAAVLGDVAPEAPEGGETG